MCLRGTKVKQTRPQKLFMAAVFILAFAIFPGSAQNSQNSQDSQNQGSQQQSPAEAGGPTGDIGPIAVPKKKTEEEKPPAPPPRVKNPEEIGTFSLKVDVPLVNLPIRDRKSVV